MSPEDPKGAEILVDKNLSVLQRSLGPDFVAWFTNYFNPLPSTTSEAVQRTQLNALCLSSHKEFMASAEVELHDNELSLNKEEW